jgi:hypothetical protein
MELFYRSGDVTVSVDVETDPVFADIQNLKYLPDLTVAPCKWISTRTA